LLTITLTATAAANPKKTGTATLFLDSGIAVSITPATASVPTGEEQDFSASLSNDLQGQGVTWLITQQIPTATEPYPTLVTCSPGCGAITPSGPDGVKYIAPSTVPTVTTPASTSTNPTTTTPSTLTVVATSKSDTTRYTIGSITIIQGGPITFKSVSPSIAPQGASYYDIFLDSPFISSASAITVTGKNTGLSPINSASQVKVLFPIATSTVTNPASTGARLRLFAANLANADTYTVTVSDPAQPVTTCTGTPLPAGCAAQGNFSFDVVPVRPTSVASLPDSLVQNASSNDLPIAIDGGYFGSTGNLAVATFDGNALNHNASSSRQLNLSLSSTTVNSFPGLYPLSVSRTSLPAPAPNNPSVTNLAVFPDYSTVPPSVVASIPVDANPTTVLPSAVDIDTRLGILVVAETGTNLVKLFSISNANLTPLPCPTTSCAVNAPTGLSINQTNHTVAVVSAQDQSVVVLPLTGSSGVPGVTYPLTISLAGLIPPIPNPNDATKFLPPPIPYSIGLDSDTNNALVAYSSTSNPTSAKVGFLLDLNADTQPCLPSLKGATAPCIHSQVTLNTGTYPQIAMLPHSHLAFVTPGGLGFINGVDVTKSSSQFAIASISVNSGLVTVNVTVPTGQTFSLNPGNPGSVLIQGVKNGANGTNFNGVFSVLNVLSSSSFTYALNAPKNDTGTVDANSFSFFGSPNISIGFSQTAQGIAINPITRTAAVADANANGSNAPQIDFLNSLDQSITSIGFSSGCTAFTVHCFGSPELLGTTAVAFQPFSNLLVSYNPQQNQVSVSNPVTQRRYALACILTVGTCLTNPDQTIQSQIDMFRTQSTLPGTGTAQISITASGTTTNLTLFGGLAVDPATNQAFVVQSGSGTIQIVNLGPVASATLKAAEISELQVPTVAGALIGGIAGAAIPQGTLTSTTTDLAGVKIFGAGFDSGSTVRLDQTPFASSGLGNFTFVNSREIDVTIPKAFLGAPHRFAVDVINSAGSKSNVTDFFVIKAVDMTSACSGGNPQPNSVAIADSLPGTGFAPIAVVSNSGCNNISVIDIAPQLPTYDASHNFTGFAANPKFGTLIGAIPTGTDPIGVAVSSRYGLAVVANNTDGKASVLDLATGTQKIAAVVVGTTPTGVAIDDGTGTALITNTGDNTVSELNLALLFGATPATTLTATTIAVDTSPIAVAIDPDRGTNFRGLAVVTAVELLSGQSPVGVLDAIDIGGATPAKSTTAVTGSVSATPTGVVFNPSVFPSLFYATSSGGNVVSTFNPDTGVTSTVHVGINPTSLAINPQTGGILTINSASQTVSIIDTISNPFKTRSTFGLGGSPQFGVAIDQFTNLAVIVDQANNRVLIFPMPN